MKNKKIVIILIIFIILLIGLIYYINIQNTVSFFKLYGKEEMTMYEDETYIEPGFICLDKKNNLINNLVEIDNSKFNNSIGEHIIEYKVYLGFKHFNLKRKVNVLENPFKDIKFELINSKILNFKINDQYIEYGVKCINKDNTDLSNMVKIESNLDITKLGEYDVKYSLTLNGKTKTLERTVYILDELYTTLYNRDYTNENIKLQFISNIKNVDHIVNPSGIENKGNISLYEVKDNGMYTFSVYDLENNKQDYGIKIDNIDRELEVTCNLEQYRKTSKININIEENDFNKFIYNGMEYKEKIIDMDQRLNNISLKVYDKANNTKEIECTVEEKQKEYDGFIIIGDSRTVIMDMYIKDAKTKTSNTTIIALSSMGYNWMLSTAIPQVNDILKKNPDKGYYILSNFGVNDPGNINKYISKYNSLVENEWKDHKVGVISLYPYSNGNENSSQNKTVVDFNNKLKAGISNKIFYCDVYHGLGYKGFTATDSGLHHNRGTSLNIYKYIINKC